MQIYTNPILNEHIYPEFYERTLQATFLFGVMEVISSVVMVINASWAWGPFIIHAFALFVSIFSTYISMKIIEGGQDEYEVKLRRSNIVRGGLWIIRFFYLFTVLLTLF